MLAVICSQVSADGVKRTGNYVIADSFTIESKIFGESREFFVSLPISYESTDTTYPVLILLDGDQNLEHSVASARMLAKWKGLPETIIVAIPSPNRIRDFTPTADLDYSNESGGAEQFQRFIENELMQFVDKSYRTHPFRVLEGHSLGGLFAASQLLSNNNFYQAYVIIAPALWWHDYTIFKMLAVSKVELQNVPLFFGIGEYDGNGMKRELEQFYNQLSTANAASENISLKEYPNEGHMSSPMLTMYDGLQHSFKGAKYTREYWDSFTPESFEKFVDSTQKTYGTSVMQTAELYVELAQYLTEKQDFQGAIVVLKENIKSYPKYPFNHELLANVYALNDQVDLAIREYQMAMKYANESGSYGDGVARTYEKEIERLRKPVTIPEKTLQSYEGCYETDSGRKFAFRVVKGQLVGSREGWSDFRLFAESQTEFYSRNEPRLPYKFVSDGLEVFANGQVHAFIKKECKEPM